MSSSDISKKEFTILLVDDREENLIALEAILTADNRKFLKATSGNEALKLTLKHNDIGLIMLDVQMPGMDGFEVAELLKSNTKTKDISIIFITAVNKEEHSILKGFEHGAVDYLGVDYLLKPLDVNLTKAKVKVFEKLYFYQADLRSALEQKDIINHQLERFTYTVAHDLKSPLHGMTGLIGLMIKDPTVESSGRLKEHLSIMQRAFKHLALMIDSILDYSRKNNFEQTKEEVDTHELVTQISHLLFPPGNISIVIDGKLPIVVTKKFKLQQVFQNLLSNAIKHNDKPEGNINVGCHEDGDFYKFYVKDNGPGIDKGEHKKLFNLFGTTSAGEHDLHGSSGIGLNIIKVLVEEQGGQVTVDSTPGLGSTFYFQWLKK